MVDPNITMEEYIRLEEEKARKRGKVFNWETAKYGKIWYDEDVLDLRLVEHEFPSIVFNDSLTSNETLSCEPTVSSLNDEIDFRISFDESDDEDYMIVFDKNSCIDDLDFFKEFENEFPAIVYNDALMSKSDFLTKPTFCLQHIDEFDLKDETTLSEYDEVEQSVLYFNDLFPCNIIYPDDKKSDKGNDDNEIDIQSLRGNENTNKLLKESHDKTRKVFIKGSFIMGLNVNIVAWNHFVNEMLFNLIKNLYVPFGILFDPKRYYKDDDCARVLRRPRGTNTPRYKGLQYTDVDIADFETRLARIYRREIHQVQVFDFGGLPDLMAEGLSTRMVMEHKDAQGDPMLRLCHKLITCSITRKSHAPEKVTVTDIFYLMGMDGGLINVPYLLAWYLRLFALGRKQGAMISKGQYVARLAEHFGLLTEERLQSLTVISLALPIIDMAELVRLQLCFELDDTWAWVPTGPARQEGGTQGVDEEVSVAPGGGDEDEEMP
nr:hypothetical protein [Tanacetum cinerariifolium]